MILKSAPLPEDIVKLGAEGVNRIWRDAKLRGAGMKRTKTLVEAAEHSIGSREAHEAARIELRILLSDYERQAVREAELMGLIEEKIAAACKLIRIFYLLLRTGAIYDPSKMMGDIRRPEAA